MNVNQEKARYLLSLTEEAQNAYFLKAQNAIAFLAIANKIDPPSTEREQLLLDCAVAALSHEYAWNDRVILSPN